jgi:RHS repeat-associated protein
MKFIWLILTLAVQLTAAFGAAWQHERNGDAGMLSKVKRPDATEVSFRYDALGRRIEKQFGRVFTRWVWDGNTPLHEQRSYYTLDWDEVKKENYDRETKYPLITWVFEEGTFVPAAKITEKEQLSVATNYLGTPEAMYREDGEAVWTCELNSYGKVRNFQGGSKTDCPFRYQGQYEDAETGLYYNRFRYYSPEEGMYLSQDPIGLAGNNPTLYGYVKDVNSWIDQFGLHNQGSGRYSGVDAWETIILKKGTVVYGGVPGQSGYYFPKETLDAADSSTKALWESLQVEPHKELGYRSEVQMYVLTKDTQVEFSIAKANTDFGKGGGLQFYIENYNNVLEKKGNPTKLSCP